MTGRKTVLVVDDDPGILHVLANGLANVLDMFDVVTASHGQEAVEILERQSVDVLVTDLVMPIMDGFALIAYLTNRGATLPVVVLSGMAAHALEARLSGYAGLRILRKPAGYQAVARCVLEEIERVERGQLQGIPLAGILQLLEAERRSCTVLVRSGKRRGRLHFESGTLLNAFSDDFGAEGEAAAFDILGWTDTAVEFAPLPAHVRRLVHTPLQLMLLDLAALQDRARPASLDDVAVPDAAVPEEAAVRTDDPAVASEGTATAPDDAPSEPAPEAAPDAPPATPAATWGGPAYASGPGAAGGPAPQDTAADDEVERPPETGPDTGPAAGAAIEAEAGAEPEAAFEIDVEGELALPPMPLPAPPPAPAAEGPSLAPSPRLAPAPSDGHVADGHVADGHVADGHVADGHVADMLAAIERLAHRAREAEAALAAVSTEVEAFQAARRKFDAIQERHERQRRELEAFRDDVARLAREILGRVDGLFDAMVAQESGGSADSTPPAA